MDVITNPYLAQKSIILVKGATDNMVYACDYNAEQFSFSYVSVTWMFML